ncbi:hypothetical protein ABZ656_11130 [Streptomyces sp. NPDC007095]|uniref:hypothetical protein n=1 Tax=Streptomyces sp. NPDC007095 TaxID=3154482 RepID=UPI0033FCC221
MPAPATAPHDGGALFPDDSGGRKSGHATAYVSRQYLGSRGQAGNGMVAATTARAARIASRALVASCRHNPSGSPHTVADHPADAMHLPSPVGADAMSPAATAMPRPRELPAAARRHAFWCQLPTNELPVVHLAH